MRCLPVGKNGETVAEFEKEFAAYVGAQYCIALCNGTASLHTALEALRCCPDMFVSVPALTMSSTSIAALHSRSLITFLDVDAQTWTLSPDIDVLPQCVGIGVDLYGLCVPWSGGNIIADAAQTLRKHSDAAFTSYSFQASKILSCGEGGALVTNDEDLATKARSFASLGYALDPHSSQIDSSKIRSPDYARHHSLGWNYRLSDAQAALLLHGLGRADQLLQDRREAAALYQGAVQGCDWLTPQHIPDGWVHDYWTYAVAMAPNVAVGQFKTGQYAGRFARATWETLAHRIEANGGERPYAAWRIPWIEPGLAPLVERGNCPVAESLQPRLMQFATNHPQSAEINAEALRKAIKEIGG